MNQALRLPYSKVRLDCFYFPSETGVARGFSVEIDRCGINCKQKFSPIQCCGFLEIGTNERMKMIVGAIAPLPLDQLLLT